MGREETPGGVANAVPRRWESRQRRQGDGRRGATAGKRRAGRWHLRGGRKRVRVELHLRSVFIPRKEGALGFLAEEKEIY